jgi:hypothetical protein
MDVIPADVVEIAWRKMAAMSIADAGKLTDRMSKKQPFVQAYLLAVGERDFNLDEAQLLHYLGMVVWQIFDRSGQQVTMVTGDMLDQTEENNTRMLQYLEGESGTDFVKTVQGLLDSYHQVEVLKYVVSALMEEPEEGCDIRDDNQGGMFIHLKTVIDCLDQSR